MPKVEITMKSGAVVSVEATEFSIQKSGLGLLAGVKWVAPEGARRSLLHVHPNEIAAIVWVEEP